MAVRSQTVVARWTQGGRSRARRSGFLPLLIVWSGWFVLMAGANLATPLYALYAAEFGSSSLVLTTIFATCAVSLVLLALALATAGWQLAER